VMLGGPECDVIDFVADLRNKGEMFNEVFSKPVVNVQLPMDVRSILSMSGEVHVEAISTMDVRRSADGEPRYNHGSGFVVQKEEVRCKDLEGKSVHFRGVDPRILGNTNTERTIGEMTQVFAYSMAAIKATSLKAPRFLWIPVLVVDGYVATGKKWENFYQHERKVNLEKLDRPVRLFKEMGMDVREMGSIEWMKDVPGDYRATKQQARSCGLPLISYLEGYSPFYSEFRIFDGEVYDPDDRYKFLIDCTRERFEYDDSLGEGEGHNLVDRSGIVTVVKSKKNDNKSDRMYRAGGKQCVVLCDYLKTMIVNEGWFRYGVRVRKKITDSEFIREFLVDRGLPIEKEGEEWSVG